MRRILYVTIGTLTLLCAATWFYWSLKTALPPVLWKFATNDTLPEVEPYETKIYIGAHTTLYALDHISGQSLWQSSARSSTGYIAKIFPGSDSVVVAVSPEYGQIDVEAFDAGKGTRLWNMEGFVDHIDYGIDPFATARHMYVGDEQNNLVAIDRKTGIRKQSISLGKRVLLQPLSSDGLVFYVTGDGKLVAMDDATGNSVWTTFVEGRPITVDGGQRPIYNGYTKDSLLIVWDERSLSTFDTRTGKLLWAIPYTPIYSPLLCQDDTLYVIQTSDKLIPIAPSLSTLKNQFTLYAVNTTTGDLRFQKTYDGWEGYPLAVVDKTLVVGGQDYIYGLNPQDGAVRWRQSGGASYYKETVIHKRLGYFAQSHPGYGFSPAMSDLKAIDLSTGRELWSRFYLNAQPYKYIYATDRVLILQGDDGIIMATPFEN